MGWNLSIVLLRLGEISRLSHNEEEIDKFQWKFLLNILKYDVMMVIFTMKYRTRTDMIVSVLEAATQGATKTKIIYSSYLSSQPLKAYLELVITNGLLVYDPTKQRYKTTERGLRLLELYNSVGNLELVPYALTTFQE